MKIIYEDPHLLVCHKPAGLATQTARLGEKDAVSELKNYLNGSYLGLVHRLDQPVEGLLVFARTPEASRELSRQTASGEMQKCYLALVYGGPGQEEDTLTDYLVKDGRNNTSRVTGKDTKDAKRARLHYRVLARGEKCSLLRVELETGRHHQIRLQLSHAGYPLIGDRKYGNGESDGLGMEMGISQPALCAYELAFRHPDTKEEMCFQTEPEGTWLNVFKD